MLKSRKIINFFTPYYYRFTPTFILNSKRFHEFLYKILIGGWFNVNFFQEYKNYSDKDWVKLYDVLFANRIREEDLTINQKKYLLKHVVGPSVLEIGPGTGNLIEEVRHLPRINHLTGNEISPRALEFLKKRFAASPHLHFVLGDFLKLKFRKKFDTVICAHVLEHVQNPQKMAKLMIGLARKRIIVVAPNEQLHPFPPNYHLYFFNKNSPLSALFPGRRNQLKIIDGDFVLISDGK